MPRKVPVISKTALIATVSVLGVLVLICGGLFVASAGYARLYEGRIFPGVRVLGVRLDGLTGEEARAALNKAIDGSLKDGLRFRLSVNGEVRDLSLNATTVATTDPDASRDLVQYDVEPAVLAAVGYGRSGRPLWDALIQWRARVQPVHLDAGMTLDEPGVRKTLEGAVDDLLPGVQDATLDVRWDTATRAADISIRPEQTGRSLDVEAALRTLRDRAGRLDFQPIELHDRMMSPSIRTADAEALRGQVPELLALAPVTLTRGEELYVVTTSTLASWIGVVLENKRPTLALLPDRVAAGVRALAPDIEKTAKRGSFAVEDGKIKSFEAGTEGVTIDDAVIRAAILDRKNAPSASVALTVHREEPALSGQDPERLGIKEVIGVGRSNFSGSPTNRRKNIANGVNKVNGTLIPPGEEFSLLKTLGPIEAQHGWLPELVIKGNETVPELGGGLCQIGTTTFRAALASGLPITQRRNHSYRVRYYEPVGTDATIYEPNPDFRFLNDSSHHILIHAYTQGDDVIYEFWGTRDGRSTVFTGQKEVTSVDELRPRVFNQVAAPPTKLIETLDLKPGEKKCTETAHAGADAEFGYTVTYADGSKKEDTFRSHYRPWQAVCLIGVEKLSEPVEEGATDAGATEPAAVENGAIN